MYIYIFFSYLCACLPVQIFCWQHWCLFKNMQLAGNLPSWQKRGAKYINSANGLPKVKNGIRCNPVCCRQSMSAMYLLTCWSGWLIYGLYRLVKICVNLAKLTPLEARMYTQEIEKALVFQLQCIRWLYCVTFTFAGWNVRMAQTKFKGNTCINITITF